MDFLDMLTDTEQFDNDNNFENSSDNLIKKTLKDGDNRFRVVGKGKVFFAHRFDSKNGVRVQSICTKDEDGNGGEDCSVCKDYQEAWKVVNAVNKAVEDKVEHEYTPEQLRQARIRAGEEANPLIKFKQSWGAKKAILYNVIDRDNKVNKGENHTSLLCKSDYDLGISAGPKGIYEQIVKLLTRHRVEIKEHFAKGHDWLPFDTILIKSGKGMNTSYDKERCDSEILTEVEIAYERYNLEELTMPTKMEIVDMWLTKGTKKKKDENDKPVADNAQTESDKKQVYDTKKEETKTETKAETKTETKAETKTETKSGGFKSKAAPKEESQMDACPSCNKQISITSTKCPECGEEFEGYDSGAVNPY